MKQNMAALVAEAEKGSQAAYEALYQETKQMVYFTCFGLLKSEADAADQMQETYITAFLKLDTLEEPEKFPAWIKRIAVNKCKDFLVQKKSWFPLFEEEEISVEFEETDADFLPESYITVQSKRRIVQQIMQKELSDVQYRIILLYYYDELSLAEIAGLMECSEGTIKSRLHTARERIKEGVLKYEEKHKDKLYSIAALPFLVQLLQREAAELQMPEIRPDFLQGIKKQKPASGWKGDSKQNANQNQKGGKPSMEKKGILSTTAGKVIAAALVLLIVGGGLAGTLIAVSHGGQGNDSGGSGAEGNADVSEGGDEVISENEELFCQIPFTDAATGEDYLSGHILSAVFYGYNDDYAEVYLVLEDKHNIYKCTFSSDVYSDNVLLSDGRLIHARSPIIITDDWRIERNVDEYTFEERVLMEGVESLYGKELRMAVVDNQGNIHVGGAYGYDLASVEERDEIIPCDYEGEILDIYKGGIRALFLQTTETCYYSHYCYDILEDSEPIPLEPLTALDSASSPIKKVVDISSIGNVKILFLLEDGTIWGYVL